MSVVSSSSSRALNYPNLGYNSLQSTINKANHKFNVLLANIGALNPELISELRELLTYTVENTTIDDYKDFPMVARIIELISSSYIQENPVALSAGLVGAAPVTYASSSVESQNGKIDYYSLTQLSFLAAILNYSLEQANLNLESAATVAEYMQFYEIMTNLVNNLISFTTALNSIYKETLSMLNLMETKNSQPTSTVVNLVTDFEKIVIAAFNQNYEDNAGDTGSRRVISITVDAGSSSNSERVLSSVKLLDNGSVQYTVEIYSNGSWVSATTYSASSIDNFMHSNGSGSLQSLLGFTLVNGKAVLNNNVSSTTGDLVGFIGGLYKIMDMQSKNCLYMEDIPPEYEQYFPLSPYGGYELTVTGINKMMADISNTLALVMPEYTETTFVDNWGQNILNSTGCEQMLGAVSGLNTTISQKATSTADKVGLLQDQINLARSLVSSFTDMVKQIINF